MRTGMCISTLAILLAMTAASLPAKAYVNWSGPGWYIAGYTDPEGNDNEYRLASGPYSTEDECRSALGSSSTIVARPQDGLASAWCDYATSAP